MLQSILMVTAQAPAKLTNGQSCHSHDPPGEPLQQQAHNRLPERCGPRFFANAALAVLAVQKPNFRRVSELRRQLKRLEDARSLLVVVWWLGESISVRSKLNRLRAGLGKTRTKRPETSMTHRTM
ncbi:uncharacterized protein UHOD_12340 [Ustilago sp. UG-2017b]|nr:uncharacterized protein UHOD_12340 [Ustilago sp. UG-2017b]